MNITNASMNFMNRRRILTGRRQRPRYEMCGLQSNKRPVEYLPEMLTADTPASKVYTQKQEDRIPYRGQSNDVYNPDCGHSVSNGECMGCS